MSTVEIIDRILTVARTEMEIRNTDAARSAWANAAALLHRARVTGKMAGLEAALAAAERWGRR